MFKYSPNTIEGNTVALNALFSCLPAQLNKEATDGDIKTAMTLVVASLASLPPMKLRC